MWLLLLSVGKTGTVKNDWESDCPERNCSINRSEPFNAVRYPDTESVRRQLLPLLRTGGKDTLLGNHSYGSIPGGAARDHNKGARTKEGKAGGGIDLIYMSTFVAPEGIRLSRRLICPVIPENQMCCCRRNVSPSLSFVLPLQPFQGLGSVRKGLQSVSTDNIKRYGHTWQMVSHYSAMAASP